MKRYYWIKGPTMLFTWSKRFGKDEATKPVDMNDPSLPDEIVDIDPDADAFADGATDA